MSQYSLVMLNGPTPGASVALDPVRPLSIGRDTSRDLPLDDHQASRLHARVWSEGGRWQLEDCGSRNGTLVNGQAVERAVLEPGDLIRIGGRLLVFVSEEENGACVGFRPSRLAATTYLVRLAEPDQRELLAEQLRIEAGPRPVRAAALLCRLATRLHQARDRRALMRRAVEALVEGVGADAVAVWLAGADGRLRPEARYPEDANGGQSHLLASLALENNEALLVEQPPETADDAATPSAVQPGAASLAVPIPGERARRGAIECHRGSQREPFDQADLDFAIAVAHQLGMALENRDHRERLEQANQSLRQRLKQQTRIVGSSPAIQELLDRVARVAASNSTTLVLGESGTGKELVAQSIHELSPRSEGPYVAVNCAAISETLLESELFGHEAGAFTGAQKRREGQFERAHRGTIFLDEVGEMSAACQAKLLRVLEGHPYQRLGGSEPLRVDVRIVAATHRDLEALVRDERFREDLFYRLRVIELRVPPLRERGEDVVTLAGWFVEMFHGQIGRGPRRLSERAAGVIRSYPWPGNVRELKNAIERAMVLGQGEEVLPDDLGLPADRSACRPAPQLISLAEAEKRHIAYVLEQLGGNKTQACKLLGIGRGTLYTKLGSKDS